MQAEYTTSLDNQKNNYFFSIITVNLNNKIGLQNSVESVLSQTYTNFELIIVDGFSDDGSRAYLDSIKNSKIKIISEKDNGIYQAMNKGINFSCGNFILFMNSGDIFYDKNVLVTAAQFMKPDVHIAVGISAYQTKDTILYPPVKTPYWFWFLHNGIRHQSAFIARGVFEEVGLYNEKNKIVSDHEFFLLALGIKRMVYQTLPVIVSSYEGGGISGSTSDPKHKKEFEDIFERHIPFFVLQHYKENESILNGGKMAEKFKLVNRTKTGKILIGPFLLLMYWILRFNSKNKQ